MLATEEIVDLCTTCNDTNLCKPNSRRPVLFCEEFDDYQPLPEKESISETDSKTKTVINSEIEEYKFLGLCINCDFRESCPLAKTEGGIWHCEEYK